MLNNLNTHESKFVNGNGNALDYGNRYGSGHGYGRGFIRGSGLGYSSQETMSVTYNFGRKNYDYPFALVQFWF